MSLYFNWNASPKTRIYINGRGNYSDIKSPAQELHNYGWQGSIYGGMLAEARLTFLCRAKEAAILTTV